MTAGGGAHRGSRYVAVFPMQQACVRGRSWSLILNDIDLCYVILSS